MESLINISEENNYFYCYSIQLMYFLKSQNLKYLNDGYNLRSMSRFYKFKKSDELDRAIQLWNLLKQLKSNN